MMADTIAPLDMRADRLTVVGVFDDAGRAEDALNALRAGGFNPEQVSVVAKDSRTVGEITAEAEMGSPVEGAGTGAFLGGVTGGVLGWLVGIGALALPGLGPIVAAGALATTLGGAALGAVAGGLIGALVDLGIPEEEARVYEESVRGGGILLTVHASSPRQADDARELLTRHGGADVRAYGLDVASPAASDAPTLGQAGAGAGAAIAGPADGGSTETTSESTRDGAARRDRSRG